MSELDLICINHDPPPPARILLSKTRTYYQSTIFFSSAMHMAVHSCYQLTSPKGMNFLISFSLEIVWATLCCWMILVFSNSAVHFHFSQCSNEPDLQSCFSSARALNNSAPFEHPNYPHTPINIVTINFNLCVIDTSILGFCDLVSHVMSLQVPLHSSVWVRK